MFNRRLSVKIFCVMSGLFCVDSDLARVHDSQTFETYFQVEIFF